MSKTRSQKLTILVFIALLLLCSSSYAVMAGSYDMSIGRVLEVIAVKTGFSDAELTKRQMNIIWNARIPRVILAITAGAALSAAGAVYQSCFKNPLVEPYILGVSSGAAFGASLGIVFPYLFINMQMGAFLFALAAVALAWFVATSRGDTPAVTLVLAGVIVGSIFSAFVAIMKYVSDDTQLREITFWMMGGFYNTNWTDVRLNLPVTALCILLVFALAWRLNILSMGDEEAKSLGVSPGIHKIVFIGAATLMTAVCVSTVGIIAWVGLMMPHAARLLFGPDNRWVIPACALMGGVYMVFCDTVARTLTGAEIPIGIITAIIGAPYLIWLLRSKGKALFGG